MEQLLMTLAAEAPGAVALIVMAWMFMRFITKGINESTDRLERSNTAVGERMERSVQQLVDSQARATDRIVEALGKQNDRAA